MSAPDTQMLSFILKNLPDEWEKNINYNESYKLRTVLDYSEEYRTVNRLFKQCAIKSILRVQNPFQYGRFKLRQEMRQIYTVETVFHVVHSDDLSTALKYTCDYRRYNSTGDSSDFNKQPKFYSSASAAINNSNVDSSNAKILVVYKMTEVTLTQSDYYVQYVVSLV